MDHVTGFSRQPHEAAIIILPVLALTGRGRWVGRGDLRLREVKLLAPPHTASEWVEPEPLTTPMLQMSQWSPASPSSPLHPIPPPQL